VNPPAVIDSNFAVFATTRSGFNDLSVTLRPATSFMKTWVKRISLVTAILLTGVLGFCAWSYYMLQGTPDWYSQSPLTDAERAEAANRVDQKLLDALSWASEVQAKASASVPSTAPTNLKTVTFSEAELNAFFQKWNRDRQWHFYYDSYLADPVVAIHDGRIIVAGKLKELGAVASLHFEPTIDKEGNFHLKMARMLGGKLPLPASFFNKYRDRLVAGLERRLPVWQQTAQVTSAGANGDAVSVAMSRLFMNALDDAPSDPTIFLPTTSSTGLKVPVRLYEVNIEDKTLTLSVLPLTSTENTQLMARLKETKPTQTALTQ
jgi:hypothetical protein